MKRSRLIVTFLLVFMVTAPTFAAGWNPFAKKEDKHALPKFTPPQQLPRAKTEPSTWDKVSGGTKKFFHWLNPFDNDPAPNQAPAVSQRPKNSFSSFSKTPATEPEKPKTVTDFLALPRPGEK